MLQLSHLVLNEDKMLAYNDRLCVIYPLRTGISASVPAEDLNKIISGITEEEVTLEVGDNEVLITSASTEAQISTEIESRIVEDFFSRIDFESFEWEEVPEDFLNTLALARFSVSSNSLDANNLHCVCVDGNCVFSGDEYRLSMITMKGKMKKLLIPGTQVNDLIGYNGLTHYHCEGSWIYFKTDESVIVACRMVIGEYPDFVPFFEDFEGLSSAEIELNLLPVLDNLSSLVEGESNFMKSVQISISKGKTTVVGRKEGTAITKWVTNSHGGKNIVFNVSPVFMSHILKLTTSMQVGESVALFEGEGFSHIVQLPVG